MIGKSETKLVDLLSEKGIITQESGTKNQEESSTLRRYPRIRYAHEFRVENLLIKTEAGNRRSLRSTDEEFQIPDGKYTIETFHKQMIIDRQEDTLFSKPKKYKWVKIHAIRTRENMLELRLAKYRYRDLGDFWHLKIPDFSNEKSLTDFYVTRFSPKLLLFYSSSTGKEYSNTLDRFVKTTSGFGRMWIGPRLYEDLLFQIMDKFHPTMRWFRANRAEDDIFPEKTKREVSRKVYWHARDSYETLLESNLHME